MYINPTYIYNVLNTLKSSCSQVILCPHNPSSGSDALNNTLASTSALNLTIDNYANGQKLIFNQIQFLAIKNGIGNQLVFIGPNGIEFISYIEPIPIQNGELITINSYDMWKIENISF